MRRDSHPLALLFLPPRPPGRRLAAAIAPRHRNDPWPNVKVRHTRDDRDQRGRFCDAGQWTAANLRPGCLGGNIGAEAGDFRDACEYQVLQYLIALAECLNFSRAANRCAVTQPTLSIQVRKLEDYLGMTLFERNRARVALTDDGERVLRLARIAVGAADDDSPHPARAHAQRVRP